MFDIERPRASSVIVPMLSLVFVRDSDRPENPGRPPIMLLKDLPKEPPLEDSLIEGCEEVVRSRTWPRVPSGVGCRDEFFGGKVVSDNRFEE